LEKSPNKGVDFKDKHGNKYDMTTEKQADMHKAKYGQDTIIIDTEKYSK
jgi:hypothetical protein